MYFYTNGYKKIINFYQMMSRSNYVVRKKLKCPQPICCLVGGVASQYKATGDDNLGANQKGRGGRDACIIHRWARKNQIVFH